MAIAYAVAGWLLIQVATQVFPFFNIPNWSVRLTVLLIVIGFPIAVVLAWAFEITPEGVRRTVPAHSPDARVAHETHAVARKLNTIIITVLILAVALLGWRLLMLRQAKTAPQPQTLAATQAQSANQTTVPASSAAVAFNPPVGTLAVLPFTNLNGDPKQQYFNDGITEELTNALGQNTALTVIAWNTASRYRNSSKSPGAIGAALNVATLLYGSIERENGMVRVIAELVDTRTGKQLWSDHYDDSLANIFQV
ncbi:MAG TPA: hypothetical protein VFH52_06625, partial [Rhodanobacteraceae bacterium]|nr:hypothetical protein [Rhodanobacteraceae bacterium]